MRESPIEKKTCRAAKLQGWQVHPKAAAGNRGWPDRTFSKVVRTKVLLKLIEFKAPNKPPRPLQRHRIKKLRELGYEVHVVDNVETGTALFAE